MDRLDVRKLRAQRSCGFRCFLIDDRGTAPLAPLLQVLSDLIGRSFAAGVDPGYCTAPNINE